MNPLNNIMSKFDISTYYVDTTLPVFKEVSSWTKTESWYIGTRPGRRQQLHLQGTVGMSSVLTEDGSVPAGIPLAPDLSGVWRQPYGWDDESCKRRAPLVWNLFDYINKEYLNSSMTLDGFGEEIGGTQHLFELGGDPLIPEYGSSVRLNGLPQIWTSYCNGRTGGVRQKGTPPVDKTISKKSLCGAHMDSPYTDSKADGYYSMIVCINDNWSQDWGGELQFHDLIDDTDNTSCTIHKKRGYGIGYIREVYPNEPGLVILAPSTTVHSSFDKYTPQRNVYQRRIMFRCREK